MRTNAASSVKDGRYYLQLAGAEARERLLLAAAMWKVPVGEIVGQRRRDHARPSGRTTTYGKVAALAARTPHPNPKAIAIKSPDQWTLMGTEQKNRDMPMKVTGETLRDRRARARHEVGGREVVPRLRRRREELRLRRGSRQARCALGVRFPIPDPKLTRGRVFSGGVAVIADIGTRRRRRSTRCRSSGGAARNAAFNTANMHAALLAALDEPGHVRVNDGDVDAVFARATEIVEATYSTPYLPRARMEPGNATVLVTDDRVDIWIGDQSPQETRFSAAQSRASRKLTSICTCAISAAASAATATGRKPSRRS